MILDYFLIDKIIKLTLTALKIHLYL